jgi:hypothetical protein
MNFRSIGQSFKSKLIHLFVYLGSERSFFFPERDERDTKKMILRLLPHLKMEVNLLPPQPPPQPPPHRLRVSAGQRRPLWQKNVSTPSGRKL